MATVYVTISKLEVVMTSQHVTTTLALQITTVHVTTCLVQVVLTQVHVTMTLQLLSKTVLVGSLTQTKTVTVTV